MKLRKEQLELFAERNEQKFVEQTATFLLDNHAAALEEHGLKEKDLERFVRKSMAEAARYQVLNACDIRFYCECRVLLGLKFDRDKTYAWAGEILRREDIDGETKINLIDEHLLFEMEEPT